MRPLLGQNNATTSYEQDFDASRAASTWIVIGAGAESESNVPPQHDLSGIVQPGRGLGVGLMADRAMREKLEQLAGFPIVPGTLNVRLPGQLERGPGWRYVAAGEITPDWQARTGQAGYFLAPVTVAGRFRGLAFHAVEPEGRGYPLDQIELFCEVHLRGELGLGDGDPIAVRLSDVGTSRSASTYAPCQPRGERG